MSQDSISSRLSLQNNFDEKHFESSWPSQAFCQCQQSTIQPQQTIQHRQECDDFVKEQDVIDCPQGFIWSPSSSSYFRPPKFFCGTISTMPQIYPQPLLNAAHRYNGELSLLRAQNQRITMDMHNFRSLQDRMDMQGWQQPHQLNFLQPATPLSYNFVQCFQKYTRPLQQQVMPTQKSFSLLHIRDLDDTRRVIEKTTKLQTSLDTLQLVPLEQNLSLLTTRQQHFLEEVKIDKQEQTTLTIEEDNDTLMFQCRTCLRGPPYAKKYARNQCQTCYKRVKLISTLDEKNDEFKRLEPKIQELFSQVLDNDPQKYTNLISDCLRSTKKKLTKGQRKQLRKFLKILSPPSSKHKGREPIKWSGCPSCNDIQRKHYAKGLCSICYRKANKQTNKSVESESS